MASRNITVEVRLPKDVANVLENIAEMAGVSTATVIRVAMASYVLRSEQKPQAMPPGSWTA